MEQLDRHIIPAVTTKNIEGCVLKYFRENFIINGKHPRVVYETEEKISKNNKFRRLRDKSERIILPSIVVYSPTETTNKKRFVPRIPRTRHVVKKIESKENQYSKGNPKLQDIYTVNYPRFKTLTYLVEFWAVYKSEISTFNEFVNDNQRFYLYYEEYFFYTSVELGSMKPFKSDNDRLLKQALTMKVECYIVDPINPNSKTQLKKKVVGRKLGVKFKII